MPRGGVKGGKWQTSKGVRVGKQTSPHLPGTGYTPLSTRNTPHWCYLCGRGHGFEEPCDELEAYRVRVQAKVGGKTSTPRTDVSAR